MSYLKILTLLGVLTVVAGQSPIEYKVKTVGETFNELWWPSIKKSINRLSWRELFRVPPESFMNTTQLIKNAGMCAEEYQVKTTDGYYLSVYRIPPAKDTYVQGRSTAIPVLLTNVVFCCSSAEWVMNLRNQSLGFVLADAGYDVWLGNYRGGAYSRRHEKYKDNTRKFWAFSYDEMGRYDVTAMIDFITEKTGHEKILAGSAGFGMYPLFFALADNPEYNKKILGFASMSGGVDLFDTKMKGASKGISTVLKPFFDWYARSGLIAAWVRPYWYHRLAPYFFNMIAPLFMLITTPITTGNVPIAGYHYNASRIPVFMGHTPIAFNAYVWSHFNQFLSAGGPIHYDWGNKGQNVQRHGHEIPQPYDLTKVTVPTLIMYAKHDVLFASVEANNLNRDLSNTILYEVDDPAWAHYSYVIFINTRKVFDRLLEFFKDAAEQERLRMSLRHNYT